LIADIGKLNIPGLKSGLEPRKISSKTIRIRFSPSSMLRLQQQPLQEMIRQRPNG
jgi:hypothetical protein